MITLLKPSFLLLLWLVSIALLTIIIVFDSQDLMKQRLKSGINLRTVSTQVFHVRIMALDLLRYAVTNYVKPTFLNLKLTAAEQSLMLYTTV